MLYAQNLPLKIAFCKSEYYRDLYTDTTNTSWRNTVLSSSMRSGPIGLFANLDTRFFIIRQDEYSTDYWKQKISDCRQGSEDDYFAEATRPIMVIGGKSKRDVATSAIDIDWNDFDIVIALDACISQEITSRYPTVLWAYYISEGCMSEYSLSRQTPVSGYNVFLNQRFRHESDYIDDPNQVHEIDFPYHLMDVDSVSRLLRLDLRSVQRRGIFIDKDTRPFLNDQHRKALSQYGPVVEAGGNIQDLLSAIAKCKYYLRLGDRSVWGNASIEAVSCGALLLSSTRGYRNRIFGGRRTFVEGIEFSEEQFEDAVRKISYFERDPYGFNEAVYQDRRLCARICLQQPIQQLVDSYSKIASPALALE